MVTRPLEQTEWQTYFDTAAKALEHTKAEIEVSSLMLGHHVQANWMPLVGISYDPHDDTINVALEKLEHVIRNPLTVFVNEEDGALTSIEVQDDVNVQNIIRFRYPAAM